MKRSAAIAAALLLGLGATACGGKNEQQPTPEKPASSSLAPAQARPKIPHPSGNGTWVDCPEGHCQGEAEYWIPNPNGDGTYVPCEGTICTNPNHGAGPNPEDNGGAEMPSPEGDGSQIPCEGTVCTNPNHGGGDDADDW